MGFFVCFKHTGNKCVKPFTPTGFSDLKDSDSDSQILGGVKKMAEREGFEPSVRYYPYDGLANRCFRPLSHLSAVGYYNIHRLSENANGKRYFPVNFCGDGTCFLTGFGLF